MQEGVRVQEVGGDLGSVHSRLEGWPERPQTLPREDPHQQGGDTEHDRLAQGEGGLGQEVGQLVPNDGEVVQLPGLVSR